MIWFQSREAANPEDCFYRFEDHDTSVADEYGEHAYTNYNIKLHVYCVVRRTKCGVWIDIGGWTVWPNRPKVYTFEELAPSRRRFVNLEARKKYALPSLEAAIESYIARKTRQHLIYMSRANRATAHITIAERWSGSRGYISPPIIS